MAWKHAALITVLLWFAPLVVRGQAGDDDAKSRRQGLATDDRRIEALRRGDVAPLRQIYADDYTLVTPSGVVRSKTDQINELASRRLLQKIEVKERIVRRRRRGHFETSGIRSRRRCRTDFRESTRGRSGPLLGWSAT
jgi:Domain of unknown function (DUF4440)